VISDAADVTRPEADGSRKAAGRDAVADAAGPTENCSNSSRLAPGFNSMPPPALTSVMAVVVDEAWVPYASAVAVAVAPPAVINFNWLLRSISAADTTFAQRKTAKNATSVFMLKPP
jgi:hypothetical protein